MDIKFDSNSKNHDIKLDVQLFPKILNDPVTREKIDVPFWSKYGKLYDKSSIENLINRLSKDDHDRSLSLSDIHDDNELMNIIKLLNEPRSDINYDLISLVIT